MPRVPLLRAVTTKDSIANLWTLAELHGEVTIQVPSKQAAYNVRNKLYAHRAMLRKQALAHTGTLASHLDGYSFELGPSPDDPDKHYLKITAHVLIEFELIIPDWWEVDDSLLEGFDILDEDHTLASYQEAERLEWAPEGLPDDQEA